MELVKIILDSIPLNIDVSSTNSNNDNNRNVDNIESAISIVFHTIMILSTTCCKYRKSDKAENSTKLNKYSKKSFSRSNNKVTGFDIDTSTITSVVECVNNLQLYSLTWLTQVR
jgi:hypothetical protein